MVELNAIFNRSCHNYLGKLTTVNPVISGSISRVVTSGKPIRVHPVVYKYFISLRRQPFFIAHQACAKFWNVLSSSEIIENFEAANFTFVLLTSWIWNWFCTYIKLRGSNTEHSNSEPIGNLNVSKMVRFWNGWDYSYSYVLEPTIWKHCQYIKI